MSICVNLWLTSFILFRPHRVVQLAFSGDDDVFTFINGQLVVDLGGIHASQTQSVNLDTLGLTPGQEYQLDFFFAERHVTQSHFRIDTTIEFTDSIILPE